MAPSRDPQNVEKAAVDQSRESTLWLLERAQAGDRVALDGLVARYLGPLERWASGRLPSWARNGTDTQDLVQETLIRTLSRIGGFKPRHEGALQAYLRQALMNRIRDELRRTKRQGGPSDGLDSQAEDPAPSPLDQAIGRQATERYEAALKRLKAGDQEAIIGRLELGLSYDELALALDKPSADAARKAAQRALVRLAAEMKLGRTSEESSV
jgi:RNA polymerase sigma-70 factor (ECF subfamily)